MLTKEQQELQIKTSQIFLDLVKKCGLSKKACQRNKGKRLKNQLKAINLVARLQAKNS